MTKEVGKGKKIEGDDRADVLDSIISSLMDLRDKPDEQFTPAETCPERINMPIWHTILRVLRTAGALLRVTEGAAVYYSASGKRMKIIRPRTKNAR